MDLKKRIDLVYKLLSQVSVSGVSVELLASARQELRTIYKELGDSDG